MTKPQPRKRFRSTEQRERNREIARVYAAEPGITFAELGRRYGIGEERARQIVDRERSRIRRLVMTVAAEHVELRADGFSGPDVAEMLRRATASRGLEIATEVEP